MKRIVAVGATALLAIGLGAAPAAASPLALTPHYQTCKDVPEFQGLEKIDTTGSPLTVVVSADEGKVITAYCVKAGSKQSGAGIEIVQVDPPSAEVTISHSSGKAVSHYAVLTEDASAPEPSDEPSEPVEPTEEPTVPGEEPTVPGEEPSTPVTEPTVPAEPEPSVPADDESVPAEDVPAQDDGELAATGAGPAIGYTLLALAMLGGGGTLLYLRKRRMA